MEKATRLVRPAHRELVMIAKIREPEAWRYYTERVRPPRGLGNSEPREALWAPQVPLARHADAQTSRATLPTPVV